MFHPSNSILRITYSIKLRCNKTLSAVYQSLENPQSYIYTLFITNRNTIILTYLNTFNNKFSIILIIY